MQWKDRVIPPQGEARDDHWVLAEVFHGVKNLYQHDPQHGKFPDPILHLAMDYKDALKPELDEIAAEINGEDTVTEKRASTLAALTHDGTTAAGDWTYTGSYAQYG